MTTELQKTGTTELAEFDYGEDANKGFENQTKSDVTLPWLKLLQGLSPELETVDGARPGMWYNTVTQELYPPDEGFFFVAATTKHAFAEWTPREKGKGFHGHHEPDSEIVQRAIQSAKEPFKYFHENGNKLQENFYVYGVLCDKDGFAIGMATIAFASTKIKVYKAFNSRLSAFRIRTPRGPQRPPLYAHLIRVTAIKDKNPKGEFWIPKITSADPRGMKFSLLNQDDERFLVAKQCCELQNAGKLKVDYSKADATDDEEGDKNFA